MIISISGQETAVLLILWCENSARNNTKHVALNVWPRLLKIGFQGNHNYINDVTNGRRLGLSFQILFKFQL